MRTHGTMLLLLALSSILLTACQKMPPLEAQNSYDRKNYSRAFQELWAPAKAGDPKALYAMGYMYYYGLGTVKDQDLGRVLIARAASRQYKPAIQALKLLMASESKQYAPFEGYTSSKQRKVGKHES